MNDISVEDNRVTGKSCVGMVMGVTGTGTGGWQSCWNTPARMMYQSSLKQIYGEIGSLWVIYK